jgi:hypothetical protein
MFKYEKIEVQKNIEYHSIEGAGFVFGHIKVGVGYYKRQQVVVDPKENISINTPIAEIYTGQIANEKAAELFVPKEGI